MKYADNARFIKKVIVISLIFLALVTFMYPVFVRPFIQVWQQEQQGKATLARANQERQILITQAQAEREAAAERAEAIRIVGEAAKNYPEYRQQEFLGAYAEALKSDSIQKIIYVPTEANIPVTEAGRVAADTK